MCQEQSVTYLSERARHTIHLWIAKHQAPPSFTDWV